MLSDFLSILDALTSLVHGVPLPVPTRETSPVASISAAGHRTTHTRRSEDRLDVHSVAVSASGALRLFVEVHPSVHAVGEWIADRHASRDPGVLAGPADLVFPVSAARTGDIAILEVHLVDTVLDDPFDAK